MYTCKSKEKYISHYQDGDGYQNARFLPFFIYRSNFVFFAISKPQLLEKRGFHYQFRNLI